MTYTEATGSGARLGLVSDPDDEAAHDLEDYLREEVDLPAVPTRHTSFGMLTIGAVGVVYGDIGTSPLYAFREALRPLAAGGPVAPAEVLGILSLLIWSLIVIVTVKYVVFLLRLDNRGEGGILALYTLVRLAIGRRSIPTLAVALVGAALFFGDAAITPAISVLSAVEGVGLVLPALHDLAVPLALGILMGLFYVQRSGTGAVAGAFGPVTALWFLVLAGLGLVQIAAHPGVLAAFDPTWALVFLLEHRMIAFAVLGAVFLAVTGAEALYADLGHFGRGPIALAWFALVFPALVVNYLGQGAMVLSDPRTAASPLFAMVPEGGLPWFVALATAAAVIAAQAVISGAFSLGRAAIQLGLLPRMTIRHTSAQQSGQIYIGAINWLLLVAVVLLVLGFGSSEALASAYGIAVTGTMIVTSVLGGLYLVNGARLPIVAAVAIVLPVFAIELGFLGSNLSKMADGGWVPILFAGALCVVMAAWWRGTQSIRAKRQHQTVRLDGFVRRMEGTSAPIVPGTAFFLGPDPEIVPSALLHNLRHNRVLHDRTVILTVETLRIPVAPMAERAEYEVLGPHFARLTLRFGFMETPNVTRALAHARSAGLKFDVMQSTFFLGRRRPVVTSPRGLRRVMDRIHALLYRLAADPSDYYHLPRGLVVELGERVAL